MNIIYGPDDRLPFIKSLFIGFQWAALLVATVIILGNVVGDMHYNDHYNQVLYLRKLLFISSLTLLFQVHVGHRLPLLSGPSAVLLIGIVASRSFDFSDIYTSIMAGGIIIALLAVSGLLRHLQNLFTGNVVSVVLLLIAFTIAPTILDLIIDLKGGVPPFYNMIFALILLFIMLLLHRFLKGIWKSSIIILAMIAGSLAYSTLFPVKISEYVHGIHPVWFDHFIVDINTRLSLQPGVFISFLFCFIALIINDVGSIQSLNEMLEIKDSDKRIKRGVAVTGLANMVSGFLGVIGPVNFSMSHGIIMATGCASRYTFIPAALMIMILSFLPALTSFIGSVPPVIIGTVLIYVMASQISTGLSIAFREEPGEEFSFDKGMVIGLSVFLGTLVAFIPSNLTGSLPVYLRPIMGNGFVAGVISSILLEKLFIIRKIS